jgi:hypothetical protein
MWAVADFKIGNEHNVSGFCSKQSCPLANSRYATIRSDPATGSLYLYIKAIERSHLPSRWWQKIKLPRNYVKALEIVDSVGLTLLVRPSQRASLNKTTGTTVVRNCRVNGALWS